MNVGTNWAAQLAQLQAQTTPRDASGEPLMLEEGDTFSAEVLDAKPDGTVSLRMPNGQRFLAELMTERSIVPGQRMTLSVTSVRDGMPMVEIAGEGASSVETFLRAMNAPKNDLTTALAREVLRQHTPFTPKQFTALTRAAAAFPTLEPEQAVFMARYRIPITKENIIQYRALSQPQEQLGALLQKLLDVLPDIPNVGRQETPVVVNGRDNPGPTTQPQQTTQTPVGTVAPDRPLTDTPVVVNGRDNPAPTAQPQQTTQPPVGTVAPDRPQTQQPTAQTQQPQPAAPLPNAPDTPAPTNHPQQTTQQPIAQPSAAPLPNAPDSPVVVNGRAGTPTPTNQPQSTTQLQQIQQPIAQQPAAPLPNAPDTPVVVNGRDNPAPTTTPQSTPQTQPTPQPPVGTVAPDRPQTDNPAPQTQQPQPAAPLPNAPDTPVVANGRDNPAPTQQTQQPSQPPVGTVAPDRPQTADIPRLLDEIFTKVERGRALPREMDAPRQTREIGRMLASVIEAARELPEGVRTEVMKAARDIVENLRFSDQLNHCTSFAQLPLMLNGERTTAQLYVFNDSKEKKRIDPHNATVFVSLTTANLGTVEGFVKVIGTGVDADFSLQTEDAARLFRAGLPELGAMLEAQGYRLERVNASAEKPAPSTPAKVEKGRSVRAERYRFNRTV